MNKIELVPYQMYMFYMSNYPVCYIGNNGSDFPRLCLLFRDGFHKCYEFIDWIDGIESSFDNSMNINVVDYIVKNNVLDKVLYAIDKRDFASGPAGTDRKLINNFKKYLLSENRIEMLVDAKKYNL